MAGPGPPWWRDRIWLATAVLCALIVTGAYLSWRAGERREAIRLRARLFQWQGDLARDRDPTTAAKAYRAAIQWIHDRGGGEPELQAELLKLKTKLDEIAAKDAETTAKAGQPGAR